MAGPIRYQPEAGGVTYEIAPADLEQVPETWLEDPRFVEAARAADAIPARVPEPFEYAPTPGGATLTVTPADVAAQNVPAAWLTDPRFAVTARAAGAVAPTSPVPLLTEELRQAQTGIVPGAAPPAQRQPLSPAETEALLRAAQPPARIADGAGSSPAAQAAALVAGAAPVLTWRPGQGVAIEPPGPRVTGAELGLEAPPRGWQPGMPVEVVSGQAARAAQPAVAPAVAPPIQEGAYRFEVAMGRAISGQAPARHPGRPAGQPPDAAQLLGQALAQQQGAIAEAGTVAARVEEARVAGEQVRQRAAAEARADQAQLATAQREAAQTAEQDYRLAVDALKTPTGQINPARWWQRADTGQKILGVLASVASGMAREANPMDRIIETDIAAQKDQLDRLSEDRRLAVQGKLSLLGAMRARFGDEQAALAATRAAAYEQAAGEARILEGRATVGTAKAQAAQVAGELQAKSVAALEELRQRQAQTAAIRAETALTRAKTVAAAAPSSRLTEKDRDRLVSVPGFDQPVAALNKRAADKLSDATAAFEKIDDAMGELVRLREEYGSEDLPTASKRQMNAQATKVRLAVKEAMNMGAAFTESEQAMVDQLVGGDPTAWGLGILDQMRRFQESGRQEYRKLFRLYTGSTWQQSGRPEGQDRPATRAQTAMVVPPNTPRTFTPPAGATVPFSQLRTQEAAVRGIPVVPLGRGGR